MPSRLVDLFTDLDWSKFKCFEDQLLELICDLRQRELDAPRATLRKKTYELARAWEALTDTTDIEERINLRLSMRTLGLKTPNEFGKKSKSQRL